MNERDAIPKRESERQALRVEPLSNKEPMFWGQSNPTEKIPGLIASLNDRDIDDESLLALVLIGGPAVPGLRNALNDPDDRLRQLAGTALEFIERFATPDIPGLVALMSDGASELKWLATEVLVNIGGPAVPALNAALMDQDFDTRDCAAQVLGRIGAHAELVLAGLIETSKSPDQFVRSRAVGALGTIGRPTEAVLLALKDALKDQSKHVRWAAVNSLSGMGRHLAQPTPNPSLQVIPGLTSALADPDDLVRRKAAVGLSAITAEAVTILASIAPDLLAPNTLVLEQQAAKSVSHFDHLGGHWASKNPDQWANLEIKMQERIAYVSRRMTARPSHPFCLLEQDRLLEFYLLAFVYREERVSSFRAAQEILRARPFRETFARDRGWNVAVFKRLSTTQQTFSRRLVEWNEAFSHVLGRSVEVFILHTPVQPDYGPRLSPTYLLTEEGLVVLRQLEEFFRTDPPKIEEDT